MVVNGTEKSAKQLKINKLKSCASSYFKRLPISHYNRFSHNFLQSQVLNLAKESLELLTINWCLEQSPTHHEKLMSFQLFIKFMRHKFTFFSVALKSCIHVIIDSALIPAQWCTSAIQNTNRKKLLQHPSFG